MAEIAFHGRDSVMRAAAFAHVRMLGEVHDHLTANELKPGFVFQGERIPLVNPQRGIFTLQRMRWNDATALRAVKQRLYQASFREAVITAYNGRCALSGLPEVSF